MKHRYVETKDRAFPGAGVIQAIVSSVPRVPGPECDSQHPHIQSQVFGAGAIVQ